MEQEIDQELYEEEEGIRFSEFLSVLFGRKLLLLIVAVSTFLVASGAIFLMNGLTSTYEGLYNYYVASLADGAYIDGSRFDVRDLVTLNKLEKYKSENPELSKLNMEKVYYNGVIQSLRYEVFYKKNENKLNEEDDDYVVDKSGFYIVLTKRALSLTQAQTLTKAIANEANIISQQIVEEADYTQYLKLYTTSRIYENQIAYLEAQLDLISSKYDNLIRNYGDVVLSNGSRISDVNLQMLEHFQNVSFSSLRSELASNGYVKDYTDYDIQIKKEIEALEREKNVDILKKQELINQRDALLSAAGSLYSVELAAYNEEIIDLSNRIFDIDEEISLLQLKLDNMHREDTDPDYAADLAGFNERLTDHFNSLKQMTEEYSNIEKEAVKKYSIVYFDKNSIVESKNGIKILMFLAIAAGASVVVGLVVNLCVDGKKLTKKYRDEMAKNTNQ